MGNIAFLRKQAGLARRAGGMSPASTIRGMYREYFETVQQSLQRIDKALLQISKAFD
jgi:aspartate/glutamate racemase